MYPICNVGHADLVELKNGEWYAVMLGSRLIGGYHKNLGRETFIAPVVWEDGWPVISPGTGKIEWSYPAPDLPEFKPKAMLARDDFDEDKLGMVWNFLGTPYEDFYTLKDSKLILKLLPRPMSPELKKISHAPGPGSENAERVSRDGTEKCFSTLSFIGRRQQHIRFSACAKMSFWATSENETAGLVVMQANNHQLRLERSMEAGKQILRLVQCTCEFNTYQFLPDFESKTTQLELAKTEVNYRDIYLKITADEQAHSFYYGSSEDNLLPLFEKADGRLINPESVGGMIGTYIGMFASSNGAESDNSVAFDWFEYSEVDEKGEVILWMNA